MIFSQRVKRYGKAFIGFFYKNDPSLLPYDAYQSWITTLAEYKKHLLILSMGSVPQPTKDTLIDELVKKYILSEAERKLLTLLCAKRDIHLLPTIIQYLCLTYQEAHNKESWTITSATELSGAEQKKIVTLLTQKRSKEILPQFATNPSIYAGFIMQNKKYYWDCSLHAFLKKITCFVNK